MSTDTRKYTEQDYDNANSLVGKNVWYFSKSQLKYAPDADQWSYLPFTSPQLNSTLITGVSAEIKKISDGHSVVNEWTKLKLILKNPLYVKPEPVDEQEMGFPKQDETTSKEWHLSYTTLNVWFFESKELAIASIK